MAAWSVDALVALAPPGTPNIDAVRLDYRVFAFSLIVTVGSGVLFGLVPAWLAARTDVVAGLREVRPTMGRAGGRVQRVVCVAQVALAVTVLASAALLAQSLVRLSRVDPGFRTEGLLTFGIELPRARYPQPEQRRNFFDDLRGRLSALPGVRGVTQTTSLPFRPASITSNPISVEGSPASGQPLEAERRFVLPNFFDVVGIRVLEGQGLPDNNGTGDCRVLVSRATVGRLWPDGGAIGARIVSMDEVCSVVGIVSDMKERSLAVEPLPTFYKMGHQGDNGRAAVIVRTDLPPESLVPAVRRVVAALDSELPVLDPASMETLIRRTLVADRYRTIPLALFAFATVLLAAVGTYGVMAQIVNRQTRTIGIRLALGAGPSQAMASVLGHAAAIAIAGVAVGLAGAVAASRVVRAFLFGVGPTDVLTYAAVALALALLTLLAGWIPARRATRLDPARVLRAE